MQQRDARLPQVAAWPRPLDLVTLRPQPPSIPPEKTAGVKQQNKIKPNWEQMKLQKSDRERKPNRRTRRKQKPGGRAAGGASTKSRQLSKQRFFCRGYCARDWAGWADGGSRNLGLRLESCRAVASSRPGRESLLPSLAHSLLRTRLLC